MIATNNILAAAASTPAPVGKSSVLNIRIDDQTKALIAGEAIRDGRSMSQITLRAIQLGLAQMLAPTPAPVVEVAKVAPKVTKGKGKGKGGEPPAAPAAPVKPRKK
jgi:hypothetical protein